VRDSLLRLAATGPADSSETMQNGEWDVSAWTDSLVYLSIVDQSEAGHISIDSIREYFQPLPSHADVLPTVPSATLDVNVPNPFNPRTTIAFEVARAGRARLDIFDVRGRRLRCLLDAAVAWKAPRDLGWEARKRATVASGTTSIACSWTAGPSALASRP
jgi:hypothetical protein